MKDIMLSTLSSTPFFVIIALLYMLLTLCKVNLLTVIQPKVLSALVDADNPLRNFPANFLRSLLTDGNQYKLAALYVLRYKKSDWPVIDNRKIKSRINFLNGLTRFISPYLLTAFLWIIINLLKNVNFAYDPLSITLGEVQTKLNYIESQPWIKWMRESSGLFMLLWGLLCVAVPILLKRNEFVERSKYWWKFIIGLLLIGANVSFFGAASATYLSSEQTKLRKIETIITNIHDDIFVHAAAIIIQGDLGQKFDSLEFVYRKQIDDARKNFDNGNRDIQFTNTVKKSFDDTVNSVFAHLRARYLLDEALAHYPDPPPFIYHITPLGPDDPSYPSIFNTKEIHERFKKTSADFTFRTSSDYTAKDTRPDQNIPNDVPKKSGTISVPEESYILDKNKWNIENGYNLQQKIIEYEAATTSASSGRLKKLAENAYEYFVDNSLEKGMEKLAEIIGPNSLLKEVLSLIADNYKEGFVSRITSFIDHVQKGDKEFVWKRRDIPAGALPDEAFVATDREVLYAIKTTSKAKDVEQRKTEAIAAENARKEELKRQAEELKRQANIALENERSEAHFSMMKERSRWESMRARFDYKAVRNSNRKIDPDFGFSPEQARKFHDFLNDWRNYCAANQDVWYKNTVTDLEGCFYDFIKNYPDRIAAWGFVVQQEDWDGLVNYYSYTAPDHTATGKPYYTLKYYCDETHRPKLYTEDVNNAVNIYCPN